jgi:hypothetical protein
MFGKRIDLFKLFGFETRIDLSWAVLAILIAWSLSAGLFPFRYEGLSTKTYWIMGIVGAIGLFYPSSFTKWLIFLLPDASVCRSRGSAFFSLAELPR